jgi:uncharacterized protein
MNIHSNELSFDFELVALTGDQRSAGGRASTRSSVWGDVISREPNMTNHSVAQVPTGNASRYLQQVCKHWQHNLEVTFTPEHGTIVFPKDARGADHPGDALVTFDAKPETLDVRIDATSDAQLEGLKGAVARHLDRFAFREAPLAFDWK